MTLPETWRRQIPAHWGWTRLKYVAEVGTGHTPDRSRPDYWIDCSIPWVTAADLSRRATSFDPLLETDQKISAIGLENSAAVLHPTGTVMFCRTASVGLFCITGKPMATTQAFVTWSCGAKLHSRYLLYLVEAIRPEFDRLAYGSTHLTIYMPDLEAVSIPLPPLDEQRRIADFLDDQVSRIDNIAAAREKQIELSYSVGQDARARALAGGERNSLDHHPLLGKVDSIVRRLNGVVRRIGVGVVVNPSSYFVEDGGVPFLHGGNVREERIDLTDVKRISTSDSNRLWRSRLDAGDLVVVRAGYPGRAAVVPPSLQGANCASILVIKPDIRIALPEWLELFFNSPQGRSQVSLAQYGAAQEQINVGDVVDFQLPVPTLEEQAERLADLEGSLSAQAQWRAGLESETRLLNELKRSLISAAVTGEFDVTAADGSQVPV